MEVIIAAVDSDVGYDGAEFNSVCCKHFQSKVSIINALYSAHVKWDF